MNHQYPALVRVEEYLYSRLDPPLWSNQCHVRLEGPCWVVISEHRGQKSYAAMLPIFALLLLAHEAVPSHEVGVVPVRSGKAW